MQDETVGSAGNEDEATPAGGQTHPQLWAVNLISDPIHGYIELTKRLTPDHARRLGMAAEEAAEGDLLDSAWLQRLRRISQLQSARWVFPVSYTHLRAHETRHDLVCRLLLEKKKKKKKKKNYQT